MQYKKPQNIGRISIADLTLIENPAEFFQQQEDILATFDFIRVPAEQQQKQEQQQQHERASGEGDGGCGPPVDGQSGKWLVARWPVQTITRWCD